MSAGGNLVPRVSHLTAPGGKMRGPGNEVGPGENVSNVEYSIWRTKILSDERH